jgi:hypothetical protein
MSGDGRNAVFVGTMLQTGDSVALCDECLVPWAAAVLHAMTGVDPAPFLAAVSDPPAGDGEASAGGTDGAVSPPADEPDPTPATPKDGRTRVGGLGRGMDGAPTGPGKTPTPTSDPSTA